ncbi:zinc ribbon domain-containing protein [Paenibacillus sp. KACC 21273]|uniref:zinc ribbon domain-containing protein n=1 Tax=Paenibacillus sp. KACC 21273 TaxID=3025665 RepID=UPI002366D5AE|nr:zinc ribbon domain-containing protein [Paenibacillus sp. KACC 21273]WDF50490.1 zinc ribbon domain-containing protein [Paenibacillus sp. KACC 21273]
MNLLQRLKSGAGKATERAQNAVEINRLNGHVTDIEREIEVHYLRMGQVFYEGYRAGDMSIAEEEMTDLCKACDLLMEEIDEVHAKIAVLKNERVCECGTVVSLEANFCPNCGRKMEKLPVTVKREQGFGDDPDDERNSPIVYPTQYEQELDEEDEELQDVPVDEEESRRAERLREEHERQEELDRLVRSWKENLGVDDNVDEEDFPGQPESKVKLEKEELPAEPAHKPVIPAAATATPVTPTPTMVEEDMEPELGTDMFSCQVCGSALQKGSKWCPNCGAEQL